MSTSTRNSTKGTEQLDDVFLRCYFESSLTSGIPEPQAYGAKALTSVTASKEKSRAQKIYIM